MKPNFKNVSIQNIQPIAGCTCVRKDFPVAFDPATHRGYDAFRVFAYNKKIKLNKYE
jgi:hypothetical protein